MKKIGIDARLYSQTGVGVYIRNFLYYLEKQNIPDVYFYVYVLPEDVSNLKLQTSNIEIKVSNYRWHSFAEQIGFLQQLYRDHLDLMHFIYFSYPILYRRPFIATIHDITPLLIKTGKASTRNMLLYQLKHAAFRLVMKAQVANAKAVITPTQTVKEQLIEMYGTRFAQKIHAIYEGVDYKLQSIEENQALNVEYKEPFFIYVGNFYPHKNVENLIKAYAQTKTEAQLLLIGPHDYFAKHIQKLIQSLDQQSRIRMVQTSSRSDLVFFYKHARALINPSVSEGFGLPLIEAAYFNLPILASDIAVFKELWKNNYDSFNPVDIGSIAAAIDNCQNIKKDYSELLKQYSFAKMTEKIIELYKSQLAL